MQVVIESVKRQMQDLVLLRGIKEDIVKKINAIGLRNDSILEPFENPLPMNDLGFNTNLGEINDTYLDFEVYMLPTNSEGVFIITEVNEF